MDPMVREDLEGLPQWEDAESGGINGHKVVVWVCGIVMPWLMIATVAALASRALS